MKTYPVTGIDNTACEIVALEVQVESGVMQHHCSWHHTLLGLFYVVMLRHSDIAVLVPSVFPSLLGNTSHKLWVSAPFLSTEGSCLVCEMISASTAVTGNQGLSSHS
jgi:hypothetical protein